MGNEFNTEANMNTNPQGQQANPQGQPVFQQQPNVANPQSYMEQERLLRTYKGVEFATVEIKNQIVELEATYAKKCTELEGLTYQELIAFRQELIAKQLPEVIFGGFVMLINNAISRQEQIEVQALIETFQNKTLEELTAITTTVGSTGYSSQACSTIIAQAQPWIVKRQEEILTQTVGEIEQDTREQLAEKRQKVFQLNFPNEVTQSFVQKIQQREDFLENQEVEALCEGYETKSLDELKELLTVLCSNRYRGQFTIPYRVKVDARMDAIYVEEMTVLCKNIEESDKLEVHAIRTKLDSITCKVALKEPFYQRINQRLDNLDRMELEDLCANLETRSLESLENLYTKLRTNSYNPKYLKGFLFTTELYLNKARQEHLREVSQSLFTMDKEQVKQLSLEIKQLGYEPRRVERYEAAIAARILELDMIELTKLQSDFDCLSNQEIQELMAKVSQMDVCNEAKSRYFAKLAQRQINLSYEEVTPYAAALQQFMNSIGFFDPAILLAGISNEFPGEWEKMKVNIPNVNPVEVPIVLVASGSLNFAITKTMCYYQAKKAFFAIPVEQIAGFGIAKKFLSESVVIQDKAGNAITLDGSVSKKTSSMFAQVFSQMALYINNPGMMITCPSAKFAVPPIDLNSFSCNWNHFVTNELTLANRFVREYQIMSANYKFGKSVNILEPNMNDAINKVIRNYEINLGDEFLLMYYDSSLFSTVKEGFAVGSRRLYIRNSGQPTIALNYLSILQMTVKQLPKNFTILIETVDGAYYELRSVSIDGERCNALLNWLNAFVKDMQLYYFMQSPSSSQQPVMENMAATTEQGGIPMDNAEQMNAAQNDNVLDANTPQVDVNNQSTTVMDMNPTTTQPTEAPLFCPNCGKAVKDGAIFCTGCGTKLR